VSTSGVVEVIEALIGVVFAAVVVVVVVVAIGFLVVVAFLRDEIVVLRFTVRTVEATGFRVVFITVEVAFFDGFSVVVAGRRVAVAAAVVRLSAGASGFLVVLATGFFVRLGSAVVLTVGGSGFRVVAFLCFESWIDWNVVSLLPSVVTSLKLIVVDTFRWMMVPSVVEKPPADTVYFSVEAATDDDGLLVVGGKSSNVLLL
jgi:hypothetical protein